MRDVAVWWLLLELIGWVVFPITFTIFRKQFDKGYSFSKIIALLLWGYLFWIGNIFGIISNTRSGAIFPLFIVMIVSVVIILRNRLFPEMKQWVKLNLKTIISTEIVFLIAMIFMVIMRGSNPAIVGTEKPMELTFINGILRSNRFPPNDTWLSGYSISYYYYGYLMVSMIVKTLGTNSGIAFNLALIFWFSFVSIGSFGLLINLLAGKYQEKEKNLSDKQIDRILLISLAAPLFLLILSNGEGLLELLHSRGVFWRDTSGGAFISNFWSWLDIKELTQPPPLPLDWKINRFGGTWWWRASRVLQDYTIQGQPREIIDEFPFFSYFLGDLHPHVLAMPFVLLSIFTGFEFFKRKVEFHSNILKNIAVFWKNKFNWFLAFTLGSLIFLNTWDFPIYFILASVLIFFKFYHHDLPLKKILVQIAPILVTLGIICILFYSPFLLGFASQAGGVLPSLIYQSRSVHLLIMFIPFFAVIFFFVIFRLGKQLPFSYLIKTFLYIVLIYFSMLFLSLLFPTIFGAAQKISEWLQNSSFGNFENAYQTIINSNLSFLSIYGATDSFQLIKETIIRIISDPIDIIFIVALISIIAAAAFKFFQSNGQIANIKHEDLFVGFLIAIGLCLVLFPELFYLKDQFGWRMNTIFKFYFQAWILFAIGSAYAVGQIHEISNKFVSYLFKSIIILGIISGLIYPSKAIRDSIQNLKNNGFDLDGNRTLSQSNPDEFEAINSLVYADFGIVSESVGGSYTSYGRVSKLSGLPTVLGWPGHESQWRGGSFEIGTREQDIQELYTSQDWNAAKVILDTYNIRYIYIGDLERNTYHVSEEKFIYNLPIYFTNASVTVYEYQPANEK